MGIWYSEGQKFWQKRLQDFIVFAGFFAIYGLMVDFIPTKEIEYPARILSFIVSSLLSLFFCIKIIRDSEAKDRFLKSLKLENKGIIRKCLHLMVMLIIIPFSLFLFTYANFAFSIPSILHELNDVNSELAIYVKKKKSGRYCHRGVSIDKTYKEIKGYETYYKNSACGISKERWDKIQSNDKIILVGSQSYFGFKYHGFIF